MTTSPSSITDEALEAAAQAVPAGASIDQSDLRAILEAAAPHILAAKVAEAKSNNDHIVEGGDGHSAGFHYALHCIEGGAK